MAVLVTEVAHGGHAGSGSDVTVTELVAQWLDLVQDRLSPTTMTNYRGYARQYMLRGSFGQAVWWGWIRSNPAASASPPPVRKADVHPPTPEIAVRLVAEAEAGDAEYAVFLRLAPRLGRGVASCVRCAGQTSKLERWPPTVSQWRGERRSLT